MKVGFLLLHCIVVRRYTVFMREMINSCLCVLVLVICAACAKAPYSTRMPTVDPLTSIEVSNPPQITATPIPVNTPIPTFTPVSVSSPYAETLHGQWMRVDSMESWSFERNGKMKRSAAAETIEGTYRFETSDQLVLIWPDETVMVTLIVLNDNALYLIFPGDFSVKYIRTAG